jgi:succinyl-diaminopimelate desuccinylase
VGTSEETSWEGIDHYLAYAEVPEINFIMDNGFPVVFSEKGIFNISIQQSRSPIIRFDRSPFILLSVEGGIVSNQVPALSTAEIGLLSDEPDEVVQILEDAISRFQEQNENCRLEYYKESENIRVLAKGYAAHGSAPELGHNSLWDIIRFLVEELQVSGGSDIYLLEFLNRYTCSEWIGQNLGINFDNPQMGPLTVNLGTLKQLDKKIEAVLNIRYPVGREQNDIVKLIKQKIREYNTQSGAGLTADAGEGMEPIFTSPDSPYIQTLLKAFEDTTGRNDNPISCAGTTYAKVIPNAVGFGPSLPDSPDRAHTDNEYISINELTTMGEIYLTALVLLAMETSNSIYK